MIHLTHLVFAYPHDVKFSQIPDEYDGSEIEDYGCQSSVFPVTVGDLHTAPFHSWEDGEFKVYSRRWQVAEVTRYDPVGHDGDVSFSVAILTFDGKPSQPAFAPDECNILEISILPNQFQMSWPAQRKFCTEVGDKVWKEPYQVDHIFAFTTNDKYGYEEVRILWCSPAMALA